MFNNWLKRRDESDNRDETLLEEQGLETSNAVYDSENDDDYYYYYYYESTGDKDLTIPNLESTEKEDKLEFFNSEKDTYVSPFKSEEESKKIEEVEDNTDFSYEKDLLEPAQAVLEEESAEINELKEMIHIFSIANLGTSKYSSNTCCVSLFVEPCNNLSLTYISNGSILHLFIYKLLFFVVICIHTSMRFVFHATS